MKSFQSIYKTDKKVKRFGDTEIEKHKFHQHKNPVSINNININKKVLSNKVSFCKKGFKFLLVTKMAKSQTFMYLLPKMNAYRKDFDETKYMSFLIKDDDFLE